LFKTLIAGIILGIAAGGAGLYYLPPIDQYREQSMISVLPNGGNSEMFHVNVPMDRIMIGSPGQAAPLPVGLEWPEEPMLQGVRAELFKLRNRKDAVVGVASRIAADGAVGEVIEWTLHLPARGSLYVTMQPDAVEGGYRLGQLRAGSRDFDNMRGQLSERWVAETSAAEDANAGRIELRTLFVSLVQDPPEDEPEPLTGEQQP
jgi:hypothetical protein